MENTLKTEDNLSTLALWDKLTVSAKRLGTELVENVFLLYYAAKKPSTPQWAKTIVYSTLAYFILPLDAIPDFIPTTGYADDALAIAAALATITLYIDEDVKTKARKKTSAWFGKQKNTQINQDDD